MTPIPLRSALSLAVAFVLVCGLSAVAQEKKQPTKAPAPSKGNYKETVQKKIDELKPIVDQVNQARDSYRSAYESARSDVDAAKAKLATARSAVIAGQTRLSAAYTELRVKLKDHPDVAAADKAVREARAAEDLARNKALEPMMETDRWKQTVRHREEVLAAMDRARRASPPNELLMESHSAQLAAYNEEMGRMRSAALRDSAEYNDAARRSYEAAQEAARVRRKVENDFDNQPSVKEAWTLITAASKEVMAAEKELGQAERRMNDAKLGYDSLASRSFVLNRDMKELTYRMELAKKSKK